MIQYEILVNDLSKNLVREQSVEGGGRGVSSRHRNAFDANIIINNDCKNKSCYY